MKSILASVPPGLAAVPPCLGLASSPRAGSAASTAAREALCEPTATVPPPPAAVPLLGLRELPWGWQCRQQCRPGGPLLAHSGSTAASGGSTAAGLLRALLGLAVPPAVSPRTLYVYPQRQYRRLRRQYRCCGFGCLWPEEPLKKSEECSGTTARSGGSTAVAEQVLPQRFSEGGEYKRRVSPSFVFKAPAQVASLSPPLMSPS